MTNDTIETMRRLPVYLLLDCSGSMAGEPIAAMSMGLRALVGELRDDPQALETVWLSVITFDNTAEQLVPLTDVSEFDAPDLVASGTTALGEAMDLLRSCIDTEVRSSTSQQKGDWRPLTFIFTDGEPNDDWEGAVDAIRESHMTTIVACGAGPDVCEETLRKLGDKVVRLHSTQPGTLSSFMKWVSDSITIASRSLGTRKDGSDPIADLPQDEGIRMVPN